MGSQNSLDSASSENYNGNVFNAAETIFAAPFGGTSDAMGFARHPGFVSQRRRRLSASSISNIAAKFERNNNNALGSADSVAGSSDVSMTAVDQSQELLVASFTGFESNKITCREESSMTQQLILHPRTESQVQAPTDVNANVNKPQADVTKTENKVVRIKIKCRRSRSRSQDVVGRKSLAIEDADEKECEEELRRVFDDQDAEEDVCHTRSDVADIFQDENGESPEEELIVWDAFVAKEERRLAANTTLREDKWSAAKKNVDEVEEKNDGDILAVSPTKVTFHESKVSTRLRLDLESAFEELVSEEDQNGQKGHDEAAQCPAFDDLFELTALDDGESPGLDLEDDAAKDIITGEAPPGTPAEQSTVEDVAVADAETQPWKGFKPSSFLGRHSFEGRGYAKVNFVAGKTAGHVASVYNDDDDHDGDDDSREIQGDEESFHQFIEEVEDGLLHRGESGEIGEKNAGFPSDVSSRQGEDGLEEDGARNESLAEANAAEKDGGHDDDVAEETAAAQALLESAEGRNESKMRMARRRQGTEEELMTATRLEDFVVVDFSDCQRIEINEELADEETFKGKDVAVKADQENLNKLKHKRQRNLTIDYHDLAKEGGHHPFSTWRWNGQVARYVQKSYDGDTGENETLEEGVGQGLGIILDKLRSIETKLDEIKSLEAPPHPGGGQGWTMLDEIGSHSGHGQDRLFPVVGETPVKDIDTSSFTLVDDNEEVISEASRTVLADDEEVTDEEEEEDETTRSVSARGYQVTSVADSDEEDHSNSENVLDVHKMIEEKQEQLAAEKSRLARIEEMARQIMAQKRKELEAAEKGLDTLSERSEDEDGGEEQGGQREGRREEDDEPAGNRRRTRSASRDRSGKGLAKIRYCWRCHQTGHESFDCRKEVRPGQWCPRCLESTHWENECWVDEKQVIHP